MNKIQNQDLIRLKMANISSCIEQLFICPSRSNAQRLLAARQEFASEVLEYRFKFGDLPDEGTKKGEP